ncbi:MAG TPA: branched-chain amino acid ABC transporter permease [Dehalococcoidia bacterium]|nr:branched-chain amino acid ABC transporter permease [Dehalococcoidia bacterium]
MGILGQAVASGLAIGSLYALMALALVLIYQSTDVINFAQGEMATFTTFVAWTLTAQAKLPWAVAFVITLIVAAILGALVERVIVRQVESAPLLTIVIVTLGLFTMFNSLDGLIWGYIYKSMPSPFGGRPLVIGDVVLTQLNLWAFGLAALITLALFLFFRFTLIGTAMRATAQNRVASRLMGIRVGRMLTLGWALATVLGAVAGIMLAPLLTVEPNMMGGLMIYAFAAAVLGGLNSAVGAIVGGLTLGVIEQLAGVYIGSELKTTVAFLMIVVILTIRPAGLFGRVGLKKV